MIVADQLKFTRKAPLNICSLSDPDVLFTDGKLSPNLTANCESWSTQIVNP